ncbi:MAG TPA: penicillin-binding protein [Bacteroidales bacterium]|nr:penicillin-binding protein [Bacteroidales bacterium]
MDEKKRILNRVYLLYFTMGVFGLLIFLKVIYIQAVEGEYWRQLARQANLRHETIEAMRGNIYADDNRLLATSIPIYEIRMDVKTIEENVFREGVNALALRLSQQFGDKSHGQYLAELNQARRNGERYFLIRRNVSHSQLEALRQFPIFRLGRFRGGLIVVERTRRVMPNRTLAARTIGYKREGVYVGLEGAYRDVLQGTRGKRLMQRTTGGDWIPINDENEIQPENGKDIVTTININIQDIVENALLNQLKESGAAFGTAIVMEVSTGKIKAISNLTRNEEGGFVESLNYAIGESAEPGSTFKLASMIALLEDGKVKPEDIVHTGNGEILFSDRIMRDARPEGFGSITVQNVFEVSSNVGISKLVHQAYRTNPGRFIELIRSMGLGQPLGIEISGEGMPFISEPGTPSWSRVSLPWMSIGYEVSFTPLQMIAFYNAVANGGKMMKPMFVQEIRQTGETLKRFQPQILNSSIASKATLRKVHEMMVGVVENGTARNIHTPQYKIAGKTGTVQVADAGRGYRDADGRLSYRSSFVGYFPADQPAFSCIVVIHDPVGYIFTGGQIAAPVFREIADRIFATHLRIPLEIAPEIYQAALPSFRNARIEDLRKVYAAFDARFTANAREGWANAISNGDTVNFFERQFIENLVPDVTGMSLGNALYLLENSGLRVRFTGRGNVRQQSLRPGTRIVSGSQILIELN